MTRSLFWSGVAILALSGQSPIGPDQTPIPLPPASAQGDPADSVYRAARTALSGRDYRRAAEQFGAIGTRFPSSRYAPDAPYWQAFALYRLGSDQSLRLALTALEGQRRRYPTAATKGDAAALERRVQGELARRGDQNAAAAISAAAQLVAVPPLPPTPPAPPAAIAPPTPPLPPRPPRGPGGEAGCSENDDDIKVAALNALQQMDAERAAPILKKVLARRDPASVCLRRKAIFLLAQQGAEGAEPALLDAARHDPDPEVREQAVFWLSQVGSDASVAALDSILRTTTDPDLQDKAVFALSQQGSGTATRALRAYAERSDVPEEAREKAMFWLGQSGSADNLAFLRQLYGKLKSEELKKKVLYSLAQTGTADNARWLATIARDEKEAPELRKQALFWAQQCDLPTSEFAGLYGSTTDRAMREQLIFVLSQRGDKAAADKLFDIARSDPDPELRKKALFWLGQMDDPRVPEVLQQILEH
ncbi:MAG TPA: HEAT repeat domain-containing protein [Gemmatimonadales bacterium]|nr:HEAT repeat domain-containing protein [Gemmatimonadales bacterium]